MIHIGKVSIFNHTNQRTLGKKLVIIPTYNEKENIEKIVRKVFSLPIPFSILIVDDGSPDGTAAIVKSLQKEFSELFLVERSGKSGLGTAYIRGFKYALEHGFEYIFEMDADFSHNPDDLVRLYEAVHDKGFDFAIGSRYTKGGRVSNWPIGRILMSYFASVYVRLILWISIKDTTAGFKCYSARVLRGIDLDAIRFVGYAFQIEMKYRALRAGFRAYEVPITFIDRKEGTSKMSSGIFREALLGVWQMRFSR